MRYKILVPRSLDVNSINAQTLNALALLRSWDGENLLIDSFYYTTPDPAVASKRYVKLHKLWRWRFWRAHIFYRCQLRYDAIFYAGSDMADVYGLRVRELFGKPMKVIMLLEGFPGNSERERLYSEWAEHPVYCQWTEDYYLRWTDWLVNRADAVIAISPLIGKLANMYYGESLNGKVGVLPLGIDRNIFHAENRGTRKRLKVVSAGGVKANKRPELFLELARCNPMADFVWYGDGEMRSELLKQAMQLGLDNLTFPGALSPRDLGEAFRAADIFVMPSKSEGVPKVTQEAAACGLAQVIFGYYEAPSVINGQNGFVVWSDEEFMEKLGELLDNPMLVKSFGCVGAEMAVEWGWPKVAQLWYERLTEVVEKR